MCLISCGGGDEDDDFQSPPTIDGSKTSGGPDSSDDDDEIDTEYFVIEDKSLLKGCDEVGDGSYCYLTVMGFGVTSKDAYYKGMTKMDVTIWADNGYWNPRKVKVGEKKTFTLYLSPSNLEFFSLLPIYSTNNWLSYNFRLRYYNSNNGQWYDLTSRHVTLYANK